jgi:hypothetical protein
VFINDEGYFGVLFGYVFKRMKGKDLCIKDEFY